MLSWKNIVILMLLTAFITTFFLINRTLNIQLEITKQNQILLSENENLKNRILQNQVSTLPVTKYYPYKNIKYFLESNIDLSQSIYTSEYEGYPNRDIKKKLLFVNTRLLTCDSISRADVIILLEKNSKNISIRIIDTRTQKNIYYNSREIINLWKYESLIMAFYDKEILNFQSTDLHK